MRRGGLLGVFLAAKFLGLLSVFCFSGFFKVRKVRDILGVLEVLLGIFEKKKPKDPVTLKILRS